MPYISENTINKIKERLSIADVVKDFVKITKRGKNWTGLCPFHIEKTPSFFVNEDKGIYHCFGCNETGNMFSFIMNLENVTFPESIEILAKKAGISIEYQEGTADGASREKELIYKVNEKASFIYNYYLKNKPEAAKARQYLKDRDIDPEMVDLFKLGFAPDHYYKIYKELLAENFTETSVLKAGLIIKSKKSNEYYDRFRNRLMFPIFNILENVIGFGGRIMDENSSMAKYMNTPETSIYSKRHNLYGLNITRNHIRDKRQAIIVEGYFDLISLFQAGIQNVVAPLGTALTNEQVLLLKRYADEIILLFDSDKAGNTATVRSISLLLNTDLKIRIARLPSNMDPDEFIMNHSKDDLLKLIDKAPSFLRFVVQDAFKNHNRQLADGKNKILEYLFPIINQIKNEILKSDVFRYLANELNITETLLINEFQKFKVSGKGPVIKTNENNQRIINSHVKAQRFIIMALIEKPEYISQIFDKMNINDFDDHFSSLIIKKIYEIYNEKKPVRADILIDRISDNKIKEYIASEILSDKYRKNILKQLNDCLFKIQSKKLEDKIKLNNTKIKKIKEFDQIKKMEQEMQHLFLEKNTLNRNKNKLIE
ncbi:MAG: DNA primase [Spirochaetes bacterium]|nr:DNA primase [Spirochaetota bacterium]